MAYLQLNISQWADFNGDECRLELLTDAVTFAEEACNKLHRYPKFICSTRK